MLDQLLAYPRQLLLVLKSIAPSVQLAHVLLEKLLILQHPLADHTWLGAFGRSYLYNRDITSRENVGSAAAAAAADSTSIRVAEVWQSRERHRHYCTAARRDRRTTVDRPDRQTPDSACSLDVVHTADQHVSFNISINREYSHSRDKGSGDIACCYTSYQQSL